MTPVAPSLSADSGSTAVDALFDAIGASVAIVGDGDGGDLTTDVRSFVRTPLMWYLDHVHWPSYLTAQGVPLELSLALDGAGRPTFRCAMDLADQRFRLAGNWSRYLGAAEEITGASQSMLWQLFADHLDVNPATTRSPVYHGIGYGAGGRRRGSLYFFIGGLSRRGFEERFSAHAVAIDADLLPGVSRPDRYHGVSYDFEERGVVSRTKFYAWLDLEKPVLELRDVLGPRPDLAPAQELMDYLREAFTPTQAARCTLLQSSLTRAHTECHHKVFLNCGAWKLDRPEAFRELVPYLMRRLNLDLSPLYGVLSVFSACEIPLLPLWVAIGTSLPSLTFYFAPVLERGLEAWSHESHPRVLVKRMLNKAVEYILAARQPDGSWSDGASGDPPEIVTTRLAALLANLREIAPDLHSTGAWLADRRRLGEWPSNAESMLLSQLALQRLGFPTEAGSAGEAPIAEPPEMAALDLLVHVETGRCGESQVDARVRWLLERERWSGGWSGGGDDLSVTTRVVEALGAVAGSALPGGARATEMIGRAAYVYSEHPVAGEPGSIATWLKGRLICGYDPAHSSVARALARLFLLQQPDGRWLATPFEDSSGKHPYLDPRCLLTTALAAEALGMLRDRTA